MSQLDIFTLPTIEQAEAERDTAILRTTVSNGPEFGRMARVHIMERLKEGPMSGEELVLSCKNSGITPEKGDDRSYGGIFLSLSKKGFIVKAGSVQRRRGHNTGGGILWRLNTEKQ